MNPPGVKELLNVWERGTGRPAAVRALMLMAAVRPGDDIQALSHLSIGQRDRTLLDLREVLFGSAVHCVTDCTQCGEAIELDFRIGDIRLSHGDAGPAYAFQHDGYDIRFRLPHSADLIALEGERPDTAERQLLARCVLDARTKEGSVGASELPEKVLAAMNQRMSEADPQAEIMLEVSCPACSCVVPAPFDIVSHLWTELDAWARRLLREVHTIASAYGWSESAILDMSPGRRRAYLDLLHS
jgi:hypothetical protein